MKRLLFTCSLLLLFVQIQAQSPGKADYARAVGFLWENVNNKKAYNLHVNVNWFADSTGLWYTHFNKGEKIFYQVTLKPLQRSVLFNHEALAEKLGAYTKSKVDAKNLDLDNIRYVSSKRMEFSSKGKRFIWNAESNTLEENKDTQNRPNQFEAESPDGKWIAYSENYNLFVRSVETGSVKQLSTAGVKNYEYGSFYGWSDIIEGESGERPKQFFVRWSPDSKWIQTSICDLRYARKMYLLDWSVDTLYRARLLSYYRGSPGDTTVVHLIPVAFNIENGKEIKLSMPRIAHENNYNFSWLDNQPGVGLANYTDRGFQKRHLVKIDLNKGEQKIILSDSSKTNVDGFDYWTEEKFGKIIFLSERSGWRQLYALDLKTNAVQPLTTGKFFVNSIVHVDPKEGMIYFLASGMEQGRNPYQQYLYSYSLKKKIILLLTQEEGTHEISISPDQRYFIDNYSTPVTPTVTVLRDLKTGKVAMEISKADASELGWIPPQPFTATGKDGKTVIYGLLWKPTNFDPSKKYPVIDNSYTGPHTQVVPRSYSRGLSINNQSLAELGFIVMMVDGLGTSGRSKAFHDVSYKKLGYGLEDHIGALRQLSKKFSWIDTTRVGIFGHSAGGYDAGRAMLQFPDFYKVAVASSADHDHRMEKAWWPEMYMGWPVDSAYHKQSNITNAANLKGKLLITHGGIDENVNPSATFKLAEALVRADKQFDMMIFPSQRHGYTGQTQRYFTKIRWNYFVEHLLGAQPVWDFAWK